MKIFVAASIVMIMVFVMVYVWVNIARNKALADERTRMVPWVVLSAAVAMILDIVSGDAGMGSVLTDLALPSACLYLMSSSLFIYKDVVRKIILMTGLEILLAVLYLICACMPVALPSAMFNVSAALGALSFPLIFASGLGRRFRAVKEVLKNGNVWANVSLGVDALYAVAYPFLMILFMLADNSSSSFMKILAVLPVLLVSGIPAALALRISNDSLFLFWTIQERRIVESMKVSDVVSSPDSSHIEEVYKDIYERVVAYFDREKPYLDSELTIADLVKVLYSNKLYISRAISQFTGRNFRQFVNFHRVRYSMECFRENPDLKVHEMGAMSGFNSIVSYNMAFRLFMGENPSDWCRKEKGRMVKDKK